MESIAVFVNGSEEAAASLEFGAHEAAIRESHSSSGGGLGRALVHPRWRRGRPGGLRRVPRERRGSASRTRSRGSRESEPSVAVETRVVKGQPGPVFLEESRDAALIVAARKRHAGIKELVLGSVSKHILNNSERPVVVVPILPRT